MPSPTLHQGFLAEHGLPQLIRRWAERRESGLLRTQGWLGVGFVWLVNGRIVECQLGGLKGKAALHCLMSQNDGSYELRCGAVDREPTLKESTDQLLKEHARHRAEWDDVVAKLPALSSVLVLDHGQAHEHQSHLSKAERDLISLVTKCYRVHELVEQSALEPRVTLSVIVRLLELGVATVAGSERPNRAGSSRPAAESTTATPMRPVPARAGPSNAPRMLAKATVPGFPTMSYSPTPPRVPDALNETVPGFPTMSRSSAPPPVPEPQLPDESSGPESPAAKASASPPGGQGDTPPAAMDVWRTEERIGRYDVLARLGRGGMGTVYLVRLSGEGGFQRLFALKVLRTHLAADPKAVEALYAEARIASRLNHANVVSVVEVGTHGEQPYVVMDYVRGMTFADLLAEDAGAVSAKRVVPILLDALAGLAAVHSATDVDGTPLGLIHHDVSPHNYMVGDDGVCRLTDFGIAGLASRRGTPAQHGKPAYMSPERVQGLPLDARSDTFSIGVMMWTALTGVRLFDAGDPQRTMRNVLSSAVPPPSSVKGSPECLDAICLKALQRDPAKRFASAEQMANELRSVAAKHDLLGSPADVSDWVRAAMGTRAEIVLGAQGSQRLLGPSEEAGIALSNDGSTMPIDPLETPTPLKRVTRYAVVAVAVGVLLAVILAPEDKLESLTSRRSSGSELSGDTPDLSSDTDPIGVKKRLNLTGTNYGAAEDERDVQSDVLPTDEPTSGGPSGSTPDEIRGTKLQPKPAGKPRRAAARSRPRTKPIVRQNKPQEVAPAPSGTAASASTSDPVRPPSNPSAVPMPADDNPY